MRANPTKALPLASAIAKRQLCGMVMLGPLSPSNSATEHKGPLSHCCPQALGGSGSTVLHAVVLHLLQPRLKVSGLVYRQRAQLEKLTRGALGHVQFCCFSLRQGRA